MSVLRVKWMLNSAYSLVTELPCITEHSAYSTHMGVRPLMGKWMPLLSLHLCLLESNHYQFRSDIFVVD